MTFQHTPKASQKIHKKDSNIKKTIKHLIRCCQFLLFFQFWRTKKLKVRFKIPLIWQVLLFFVWNFFYVKSRYIRKSFSHQTNRFLVQYNFIDFYTWQKSIFIGKFCDAQAWQKISLSLSMPQSFWLVFGTVKDAIRKNIQNWNFD